MHTPQGTVQPRWAPAPTHSLRTPVVRAIRTGNPGFRVTQSEARAGAAVQFAGREGAHDLLRVFDNAQIDERQLARPIAWYLQSHGFAEKNAVYREEALALSRRLAADALRDAGVAPAEVDAIVFVSTTGLSTPSLEAQLIGDLGLARTAVRVPLWGLGCAGGAAGLARAADLIRAGHEHVLLIAVEFCSLTFQMGDDSKANIIGTALFADGGAALVLGADGAGGATGAGAPLVRILHSHSELIDDTVALTGWDVVDDGFQLRLSPEIPAVVGASLRRLIDASLDDAGWTVDDLDAVMVHPGGAKVIAGYEAALGVAPEMLDPTREVLRRHGNMSSPTVLFVLAETIARGIRGRGLISATGPGFSAEHLLVELA